MIHNWIQMLNLDGMSIVGIRTEGFPHHPRCREIQCLEQFSYEDISTKGCLKVERLICFHSPIVGNLISF